ncbi:MAG: RMD1 family protein [Deltaproteobacteria bacterium]|nr:RMD1 family protein [Deltaproteobacteria bacterium]
MHELCRAKRSAIVAESVAELYRAASLIVAESAAMEYYERIVDQLFRRTGSLVERLERRGSVPFRIRSESVHR